VHTVEHGGPSQLIHKVLALGGGGGAGGGPPAGALGATVARHETAEVTATTLVEADGGPESFLGVLFLAVDGAARGSADGGCLNATGGVHICDKTLQGADPPVEAVWERTKVTLRRC